MPTESAAEAVNPSRRPSGSRRVTHAMLAARGAADGFAGVPRGTAKPLRFLAAFQEAEPYLPLPVHAFKLVAWLVKQTRPQDWEEGSRPIAWPSARRQQEFLGLSATRVKALNRALFEAGVLAIRDSEQGRRYGCRGADGRIIEAYGFDLSPLAQRYDEFVRIAAEARIERDHMKALRRRATIARRAIRAVGEALLTLALLPADWTRLRADTAALTAAARTAEHSEALAIVVHALERRRSEAEQWLKDASDAVEADPTGAENGPHLPDTNRDPNPPDTVIAREAGSRPAAPTGPPLPAPPSLPAKSPAPETAYRIKPAQLIDLAPRLRRCVLADRPTWSDIADAAGRYLRHELGVSLPLWGEACRIMGREAAAIALAIVSTKEAGHFRSGPGGYFAGMVRKAQKGELHLERTLWVLKTAKWGTPDQQRRRN